MIHDGSVLGLGKEPLRIVQQITLVITTTALTAFPLVRSPLQGLSVVVGDVKRHSHAFFTIAAEIVFVGIECVEEETIFPVGHFLVQGQDQRFQRVAHLPEIRRGPKLYGTFDFSTQSLTHFHGIGSRFQQILNGLSHHEREILTAQKAMSVFQLTYDMMYQSTVNKRAYCFSFNKGRIRAPHSGRCLNKAVVVQS